MVLGWGEGTGCGKGDGYRGPLPGLGKNNHHHQKQCSVVSSPFTWTLRSASFTSSPASSNERGPRYSTPFLFGHSSHGLNLQSSPSTETFDMARRLILLHSCRVIPHRAVIPPAANAAAILPPENAIKLSWITQFWNCYSQGWPGNSGYTPVKHSRISYDHDLREKTSSQGQPIVAKRENGVPLENDVGKNVSKKDKIKFLVNTLLDLKESKEEVYGALDAWVAWEERFPIASLRIALSTLEKEQEWHKVIQVIKWILSKGQGNTMGIYRQLIRALDMDHRAEEAHNFWMKKIGNDLHSVPWQICTLMISIYYRNNMLERLVKLFKGLEAFDRKPTDKAVVQKVSDAYELLGLVEEKNRVLGKYNSLFTETWRGHPKNSKKASRKKAKESAESNQRRASQSEQSNTYDAQVASSDQNINKDDVKVTSYSQQSNTNGGINVTPDDTNLTSRSDIPQTEQVDSNDIITGT